MKFITTLFFPFILTAQTYPEFVMTQHAVWNNRVTIASPDGGWLIGGSTSDSDNCTLRPTIAWLDSNGTLQWEIYPDTVTGFIFPYASYGDVMDIQMPDDSTILILVSARAGCDIGNAVTSLCAYNFPSGSFRWVRKVTDAVYYPPEMIHFCQTNFGYAFSLWHSLLLTNVIADSIFELNQPAVIFNDVKNYLGANVLAASDSGLFEFDSSGNLLRSLYATLPIKNVQTKSPDEILFTSDQEFFRIDSTWSALDSFDFSSLLSEINDFSYDSSGCYFVGRDAGTLNPILVKLDDSLHIIFVKSISDSGSIPINVVASDSKLSIGGSEMFSPEAFIKTFNKFSGNTDSMSIDLAITDIDVTFQYYHFVSIVWELETWMNVWVKNLGDTVINSFQLNGRSQNPGGIDYELLDTQQLHLAPGDSMVVPFYRYDAWIPPNTSCIWVSGVNNKLDRNHSNNIYCHYFSTGIFETQNPGALLLFPNPANDEIFVVKNSEGDKIRIFNAVGQEQYFELKDFGSDYFQIDISKFPPGVYLIQFARDAEIRLGKFVKE